jgi:hydrogenase maturation protease
LTVAGPRPHILLLALGNDILGDDAVGLLAARELSEGLKEQIDVKESSTAGFGLLDLLSGYDKVLILDSVAGDTMSAGAIRLLSVNEFTSHSVLSPHFIGLPELTKTARALDIPFPQEIRVLVMNVSDPFVLREGLTKEVDGSLPAYVQQARRILDSWTQSETVPRRSVPIPNNPNS